MEKNVTPSVSTLRLEGTASMCVTAMPQILIMLKAAYSILGVCTHISIDHSIKHIDILELKKKTPQILSRLKYISYLCSCNGTYLI